MGNLNCSLFVKDQLTGSGERVWYNYSTWANFVATRNARALYSKQREKKKPARGRGRGRERQRETDTVPGKAQV